MKVFAVHCHLCNSVIYSRARHDYHHCLCNNVAIDGGFDYAKISWRKKGTFTQIPEYDIGDITREALYKDWNTNTNKWGIAPFKQQEK